MNYELDAQYLQAIAYDDFHDDRFGISDEEEID